MKNKTHYPRILFLVLLLNALFVMQSKSQNLEWDKSISPEYYEALGFSVKAVPAGGYIVCGYVVTAAARDIYVVRLNDDGDTLWTKTIGGSGNEEGHCVALCADGGFIIAGYTGSYGNGAYDFFLVKTNSSGVTQWSHTNGDALDEGSYSVIQTLDSGFLAVGYTYSEGEGGSDIKAIKFDNTGDIDWSNTYGTTNNEFGYSVCQLRDSDYVIAGSTTRGVNDTLDIYVIRTDPRGDTIWTKTIAHAGYDCAYAVQQCAETGFVIAGKTNLTEHAYTDMLLIKLFDDGTEIFTQTYGHEGSDEVAYDVKETEKNGFVLVGATDANSQGVDGYVVHTDYRGDLLEETYYGGESDDEFRSVCIKEDDGFTATGTVSTSLSLVHFNPCKNVIMPRTLWFQDCWHYNSSVNNSQKAGCLFISDSLLTDSVKTANFVNYCLKIKAQTVVLGRSEDWIRQNNGTFSNYPTGGCNTAQSNGDTIRMKLFNLVQQLHITAKVAVVLVQWRDRRPEIYKKNGCPTYIADEDTITITNNIEILNAFKTLNGAQPKAKQFDGIMLDYEYFTPDYGNSIKDFQYSKAGFQQWKMLADSVLAAKGKNGIRFVQAYIAEVVFTSDSAIANNYFDYNGDSITDMEDSKAEIWKIDSMDFDKFAIDFFVNDETDLDSSKRGPNPIPTSFLTGFADVGPNTFTGLAANGKKSDEQRNRWRLQIFGHDPANKTTKFDPVFMVRNHSYNSTDSTFACDSTKEKPMLGDLLLGSCFWSSHGWPDTSTAGGAQHFLPEIDMEFYKQFIDKLGIDTVGAPNVDPYQDYGNCKIGGSQYYQQSTYTDSINPVNNDMLVLTTSALATRGGDTLLFELNCDWPLRPGNPTTMPETIKSSKTNQSNLADVLIFPNPMTDNGSTMVVFGLNDFTFKFDDLKGNDVGNKITVEYLERNKYSLSSHELENGIYIVTVKCNNDQRKIIKKFTVIK